MTVLNQSKGENPYRIFPFVYLAILTQLRNDKAYSENIPEDSNANSSIGCILSRFLKHNLSGSITNSIKSRTRISRSYQIHLHLTSQHPPFHERDIRVADDDVVQELDAEQFSAFLEPAGDLNVFPARRGVQ